MSVTDNRFARMGILQQVGRKEKRNLCFIALYIYLRAINLFLFRIRNADANARDARARTSTVYSSFFS